jgi:hypothetical protein
MEVLRKSGGIMKTRTARLCCGEVDRSFNGTEVVQDVGYRTLVWEVAPLQHYDGPLARSVSRHRDAIEGSNRAAKGRYYNR